MEEYNVVVVEENFFKKEFLNTKIFVKAKEQEKYSNQVLTGHLKPSLNNHKLQQNFRINQVIIKK